MKYYSVLKRKEILPRVTTEINLEEMMLNEMSVTKGKYCKIPLI